MRYWVGWLDGGFGEDILFANLSPRAAAERSLVIGRPQ